MDQPLDPTVRLRRLRIELRRARSEAGRTQKQVAEDLGWSPSKLLRIEGGQVGISRTDLKALLDYYGVRDPAKIDAFVQMAQETRGQTWGAYRDVLDPAFMKYLAYEGSASLIRMYEQLFVPGILQTEEYARAIIRGFAKPKASEDVMERQVEARLRRQEILDRDNPPEMFFILDEAVVRRWMSDRPDDPTVMRGQLERLKDLNSRPWMSVQVLPFTRGPHYGLRGPFTILEFPNPEDDDLLFLENTRQSMVTRDDAEEIALHKEIFWDLERIATKKSELNSFLDRIIDDMSKQR